ncbi:MAG: zinc ribbon domain-containing protein [bacterium]|nr:zinc ribbon domain-containing protein [bacterium]
MAEATNYYLVLDLSLDPPVKDKARLEAAIQKKLTEWNQGVNNPTKGLLFKSLAAKVPDIRDALLTDEAKRDAIIADALKIVKGNIATLLEAIAKAGSVTEAQVKELCKKAPQLSEKTIRKMIKVPIVEKAGPVFKVPKKPADPPIKPTDNMQMDKFEKNLTVLGKKDVYDFLGCSRTSTPNVICDLADAELEKARKAPNKTAEVSAKQELAGLITSYFKKENAKEAYDLALKTYIGQKKLVEIFAIRCVSKSIDWKSYQDSIADCRSIGMTQEEAEYFVYDFYCNKRKCPPPSVPDNEKPQPVVHYCKACLSPNPEGAAACQSCGTPFKVKCPKCGQVVDLDRPYCSKCSFPVGDMPLALKLLKDGRLMAASGDVRGAEHAIDRALVYWPGNPDCLTVKSEIEQRRKKEQAEAALREQKAKEEAAKAHLDNISISGSVSARVSAGRSVALNWPTAVIRNPSLKTDPAKITYFIVRKAGAVPSDPQDGERLAETQLLRFEDTSCEAGIIYGYSIFPAYGGVPRKGGITSPKVMTVADVSGLKATSDDGEVRLQWCNPPNLTGIKCVRKIGNEPRDIKDGEELSVKSGDQGLVDTGLKNRQVYGYKVFALYRGPDGNLVVSDGVACSASPAERPKMLDSLRYGMIDKNAKLSWTPIVGCTVRLFVSQSPIASAGTFVSETDPVFARCENVRDIDQARGEGNWRIPSSGIYYLTPATCKDGMALVGKAVPVIPCVTNVNVIRRSGNVEVSWDWPKGCDEVRLVWRNDKSPESAFDESASRATVSQIAYRRDMAYIINHAGSASYYFSVYTILRVDGKEVCSAPQSCVSVGESERRTLTYSFNKKKKFLFFGSTMVTLNIKVSGGGIPELILVKKFRRQPLSRQDGTVCHRIPATNDFTSSVLLPEGVAEKGAFLKLFFANPDVEPTFRVNHPGFSEMRI